MNNIADLFYRVIFPLVMVVVSAAVGFIFRELRRLDAADDGHNIREAQQDERIAHGREEIALLKNKLEELQQEIKALPEKIVKRIKEG